MQANSPLSLKNGIWKVVNRVELLSQLGSRILDQDIDSFKSLAISVLTESNPVFELPIEQRYAANIHGKVLECSHDMRNGIADGLAILSKMPDACSKCSQGKVETTCSLILHELLFDADWIRWGSLNKLLPTLAEVAPSKFLDAVDQALKLEFCPFDDLFSQEGNAITGGTHITGLLWALESLAWDEINLVRVCTVLGELASRDPGGQWANRPSNSLVTILLPWFPQTLASVDKRKVAVLTLLKAWPGIAWNLIIQLLPDQHLASSGSHKPSWRMTILENREHSVKHEEYWQQVSNYAEFAVGIAEDDIDRLSELIDHIDNLPQPAINRLIEFLASDSISALREQQRLSIWNRLKKFTIKHRKYFDKNWALPEDLLVRLELVSGQLAPTNSFYRYQYLFTNRDFELYETSDDWEKQAKKLSTLRENALSEIFHENGIKGIVQFAETVAAPKMVGHALGAIDDDVIEQTLLPQFLDTPNHKRKELTSGFISRRYHINNWNWCDNIDNSGWTPAQKGQFLAYLPFSKEIWDGASKWLREEEGEYWTRTVVNPYQADRGIAVAVEKLIEHDRPRAAIDCLAAMLTTEQTIDVDQCIRTLFAALSSSEPNNNMDRYNIVELIKFLQEDSSVNQDDLIGLEWVYLPLLNRDEGAEPRCLENRLANDPEFFCEVIQHGYRSMKDDQPSKEPTEKSKVMATNAFRLLLEWKTPPGTQNDGTFNEEHFIEWLQRVKLLSTESGHLEVALINIGGVLIHAPADPDGLWIHRAVADALNDRTADDIRVGYRSGAYNSRGTHWVDPTGKPEKELAKEFQVKAEKIENEGFHRFTVVLRELADRYDRQAEQIISEHKLDDEKSGYSTKTSKMEYSGK